LNVHLVASLTEAQAVSEVWREDYNPSLSLPLALLLDHERVR